MKGGDGYAGIPNQPIGGMLSYSRYSNNYRPVFEGELLQNGAGDDCECNKNPLKKYFQFNHKSKGREVKRNSNRFVQFKRYQNHLKN